MESKQVSGSGQGTSNKGFSVAARAIDLRDETMVVDNLLGVVRLLREPQFE